jgi:hypothetical protein
MKIKLLVEPKQHQDPREKPPRWELILRFGGELFLRTPTTYGSKQIEAYD